jgi:DNA-binding transcriptional ArsR family regulator
MSTSPAEPSVAARERTWAETAPLFAALGDATRLRIMGRLCEGEPLSIARLTEGEEVTRQAVTKHLHILREAGLVRGLRLGRESLWEPEPHRLDDARRCLDLISQQWDQALERLKVLVEG